MVKKSFKSVLIIAIALSVFSCKKEQMAQQDFHYDYYDLTPGRYIDYSVLEIIHDENQLIAHDTLRYELRTLIGDTIIDDEGRIARKHLRFKRDNNSLPWVQTDVWTTIIVDNRAELVEENQRLIKLVFAPTASKQWNTNAFNMNPVLTVFYSDIHKSKTIGTFTFDSTLVVEIEENETNAIQYKRKYETYAKGIGLVSKYFKDLSIVNFDVTNIKSGNELFYTCIGFGVQ
jgi:hypothetical protein